MREAARGTAAERKRNAGPFGNGITRSDGRFGVSVAGAHA
jgi:hypothetical protein